MVGVNVVGYVVSLVGRILKRVIVALTRDRHQEDAKGHDLGRKIRFGSFL